MAVLSNVDLRCRLGLATEFAVIVNPLSKDAVQPASIDVHLSGDLLRWDSYDPVDLAAEQAVFWRPVELVDLGDTARESGPYWLLFPNVLYLGSTLEHVEVPADLIAHLHGRSTLARAGIVPHQQAGLLDPGYRGRPTVEITVTMLTVLRPGQPIGQLTFEELTSPADPPYRGRYQCDDRPTPARVYQETAS